MKRRERQQVAKEKPENNSKQPLLKEHSFPEHGGEISL
jgi:hypothetical protein